MKDKQMESPADFGISKPDGAEKLPTKHYPSSGKLGQGDKNKEIIEGPGCEGRGGYHK